MKNILKITSLLFMILLLSVFAVTAVAAEETECDHSYTCVETVNPTCYSEGYYKWECTKCGHSYLDDFWVDDHYFAEGDEVHTPATCTTNAIMKNYCLYGCGEYELVEEYDTMLRHSKGTVEIITEATCTKYGKQIFRCDYCDFSEERTVSKQDHVYTVELTVVPTQLTDGVKKHVCKNCSYIYNEVVSIDDITAADVFKDVKEGVWYTDAVTYCFREGYVSGISADKFAPSQKLTRAQFVMLLAKVDGVELSPYKNKNSGFSDVKAGQWYNGAVTWAKQNGYASGTGSGKFSPNADVTREQLARFFYVYAQKKGRDISEKAELNAFTDASKVSDWATEAVKWAVANKIINGTTATTLSPRSTATRAQASQMISVFSKVVKYQDAFDAMFNYVRDNGKGDISQYYYVNYKNNEYSSATYYRKEKTLLLSRMVDTSSTYYSFKFEMDAVQDQYKFNYQYEGSGDNDIYVDGIMTADGLTYEYFSSTFSDNKTIEMVNKAYEELMSLIDQMLAGTVYTRNDIFATK